MADVAIYDRSDYRFIPSFMMRCFAVSILKAQNWAIKYQGEKFRYDVLTLVDFIGFPQNRGTLKFRYDALTIFKGYLQNWWYPKLVVPQNRVSFKLVEFDQFYLLVICWSFAFQLSKLKIEDWYFQYVQNGGYPKNRQAIQFAEILADWFYQKLTKYKPF